MSATRTRLISCIRRRTLRHCFRSSANLRSEIPDMPFERIDESERRKREEKGGAGCFVETARVSVAWHTAPGRIARVLQRAGLRLLEQLLPRCWQRLIDPLRTGGAALEA